MAKEQPLWNILKEWRSKTAKESDMPTFVILHDRTLAEIVNKEPKTLSELNDISGIGQAKLDLYGAQLLTILSS